MMRIYRNKLVFQQKSLYLYKIIRELLINHKTMEHYVNIMLDGGFKAVFGDKQVAMDLPYDLPSGRDRS
jgi:predicted DNA-binding transcriptional regulator